MRPSYPTDLGDAGEGGKQPRQRRDGPVLLDGSGSASQTGGCTRETSVVTPLKSPASSKSGGYGLDCGAYLFVWLWLCGGWGTSRLDKVVGFEGHGEGLRRSRGDAAGV
jgi:hypothetical protein